jgi:uroporphyrin-III C-methyltransferase
MLAHKNKLTLVIYMGIHGAAAIQSGLLQGLSPQTPVALVQNASRPEQRHAACLLANLQATVEANASASPSIMVVGEVTRALYEQCAGIEAEDLFGKRKSRGSLRS